MTNTFLDMLKDDEGATLVEYGLVVSLIAVAAIVAIDDARAATSARRSPTSTTLKINPAGS